MTAQVSEAMDPPFQGKDMHSLPTFFPTINHDYQSCPWLTSRHAPSVLVYGAGRYTRTPLPRLDPLVYNAHIHTAN